MKIETVAARLFRVLPWLRCPLCGASLRLAGTSLVCDSGHTYDLSRKGYVNLAPWQRQEDFSYPRTLFEHRRAVLDAGCYQPVADALLSLIAGSGLSDDFSLLDAGCGEGWYLRMLAAGCPSARLLGVDLCRDAVQLAAAGGAGAAFAVADLKRLPVDDHALDVVLDVLTPADYAEFARVLKSGGHLIKVIPAERYLCEIRAAARQYLRHEAYDDAKVLAYLKERCRVEEVRRVTVTRPVSPEMSAHFMRMTPMTQKLTEEQLLSVALPEQVTIDMMIVLCRPQASSGKM